MTAGVTIAIDAMSGDKGPQVVIPAALGFLRRNPGSKVKLVGDARQLKQLLEQHTADPESLSIVHADSVVAMDERPSHALRNKQDSSMALAMSLVAEGQADACVSAGNTGALMMFGRSILKMFPGIDRPAITKLFPSQGGGCLVLDLGANVDCSAEHLLQFALMGQSLARVIKGVERPSVALLNVGGETIKGNEQVRLAATIFEQHDSLNYVGFAEGGDIFRSVADVIVCDGFVGNVALKSAEGAAKIILDGVRNFFAESWFNKLLAILVLPRIAQRLKQLDPDTHNGAMFLGLQGVLVKSHGAATVASFEHAIDLAAQEARANLPKLIAARLDALLV